jgi:hypothetical protein
VAHQAVFGADVDVREEGRRAVLEEDMFVRICEVKRLIYGVRYLDISDSVLDVVGLCGLRGRGGQRVLAAYDQA